MQVRCPQCQTAIDLASDEKLSDIACPSCGSSFSLLDTEETLPYEGSTKTIGHFDLVEQVGMGSFGSVWKAQDSELDRVVAIKIPRKGQLDPDETEQFLREARAVAQLRHPSIVAVHEVGREQGTVYIVSDFVEGVTLADRLTARRFSVREAAELCAKIADALQHAHEQGVIHRDLKPGNIILDADDKPHIMDFGLARREAGEVTMTVEGRMLGTPAYMSPEQAKGSAHTADRRSDIYSLGVILFELLTGERPFRGSVRMLLYQVINDEAPSPRKLSTNVPKDVETICLKCLEKAPDKRYITAGELGDELRRFLAGQTIHARPISRTARMWRWFKRNPLAGSLSAAFIVAVIGGLIGVSWQWLRAENEAKLANEARQNETQARQSLEVQSYRDRMNLAYQAWNERNRVQFEPLLHGLLPASDDPRAVGFELRYLWARYQEMEDRANVLRLPGIIPSTVTSVAYSGDGRYLAVACVNGTVFLYDVSDMDAIKSIPLPETIRGADIDLSSRGTYLVAYSTPGHASAISEQDVQTLRVFEIPSSKQLTDSTWNSTVASAALTPDEESLVYVRSDGHIEIRRLPDGKVVWTEPGSELRSLKTTIAISQNGRWLARATRDEDIVLWDLSRHTQLARGASAPQYLTALVFSPDSASLWVAGAFGVTRWHVTEEGLSDSFVLGKEEVTSMSFSLDGAILALGNADFRIRLWDLENSEWLAPLLQGDYVECVAFSPDGTTLAAGGRDKVVRLWDRRILETEPKCQTIRHSNPPLAVSSDGTVASCHKEGQSKYVLKLWKPGIPGELVVAELGSPVEAVALSSDATVLAAGNIDGVWLWELARGTRKEMPERHDGRVISMAFSPDQQTLVSGGESSELLEWKWKTNRTRRLKGHIGQCVLCVAFSSNGRLASTGGDWHDYGETFVWDLDEEDPKPICEIYHPRIGRCVAFSPNGREIAATDDFSTGKIKVYSVETGEPLVPLAGHSSKTMSLLFSDGGSRLITGSDDGTIRFWDRKSGQPLGTLHVDERVRKMVLLPDGCTLVTASWDGWTRVRKAVAADQIPRHGEQTLTYPR